MPNGEKKGITVRIDADLPRRSASTCGITA